MKSLVAILAAVWMSGAVNAAGLAGEQLKSVNGAEAAPPAAEAPPVRTPKYLPEPGVRLFADDNYGTMKRAFDTMQLALTALRKMGVELVNSPESGVFQHFVQDSTPNTRYGFRIDYKGEEFVMERFDGDYPAESDVPATLAALEKAGAAVLRHVYENDLKITYLRFVSRPRLVEDYTWGKTKAEVKEWLDARLAELAKEKKAVAYRVLDGGEDRWYAAVGYLDAGVTPEK